MCLEIYDILHPYVTVLMARVDYWTLAQDYCASNKQLQRWYKRGEMRF
jgi:hypothetical protein